MGGNKEQTEFKCVTVGDGEVGKTAMLISYTENRFSTDHVPTVFDYRSFTVSKEKGDYVLNLWDTAGQEEYKKLRVLSYPATSVFLLCFSVVAASSFQNIKETWIPEIKHYKPNTPCILVGLKTDLRADTETLHRLSERRQNVVSREQGVQLAKELKLTKYMECSAKTREGLEELFDSVIKVALEPPRSRILRCAIL